MSRISNREPSKPSRHRTRSRGNGEGSIYQRGDGKWCAAVWLDGGKRKVIYGRTRQDVAKKLTTALQRKEHGLPITTERMSVGSWVEYWLEQIIRPEREPTTYAQYEVAVRLYIRPGLGRLSVAKLQPEDVERWLRDMEQRGVGLRTRQVALSRLRTALTLAMKRGHVLRNVAELVDMPAAPRIKIAAPRREDVRRLLEVIRNDRLQALVYLALGASLRRGEVLGLQWEDIDLEARTLTVRRRVNRVGKIGLIIREGAKTESGSRTVILPQAVVQVLRAHAVRQREDRLAAGELWKGPDYVGGKPTGFLFTSSIGTVLEPRRVGVYFEDVRKRAGLDKHTFHGLRHDFASLLLAAGVPGRVVMEMMGHSNYTVTANRYQHVPDELQRAAADRLDALLAAI